MGHEGMNAAQRGMGYDTEQNDKVEEEEKVN